MEVNLSLVKEKVAVGVVTSSIELVDDGLIVRFPYHNSCKRFCDPVRLIDFVEEYEKSGNHKFDYVDFNILMFKRNKLKMTFFPPIYGHRELILPKDLFIQMIKEYFQT